MAIKDVLNEKFTIGSIKYLFNSDIRIRINQFYEYDKQLRERIVEIVNSIDENVVTTQSLDNKSFLGSFVGKNAFFAGDARIPRIRSDLTRNTGTIWIPDNINVHTPDGGYNGNIHISKNGNLYFSSPTTGRVHKKILIETDFVGSNSDHGYCKFPNGMIIQWGLIDLTEMNNSENRHTGLVRTFPTAFPNKCFSITCNDRGSATYKIGVAAGDKNNQNQRTHFRVWAKKDDNSWADSGRGSYIAIGF